MAILKSFCADIHHMNPMVATIDFQKLVQENLKHLSAIEREIFDFILTLKEKPVLAIEAKLTDAKFSPQLRRFRKAVDGKFPILQVVSRPGTFLRKGPGEYLVGYDRLLMAL